MFLSEQTELSTHVFYCLDMCFKFSALRAILERDAIKKECEDCKQVIEESSESKQGVCLFYYTAFKARYYFLT